MQRVAGRSFMMALVIVVGSLVAPRAARADACDCAAEQCVPYEQDVALTGRLQRGEGTDANGRRERFEVLVLERAACGQRTERGPAAEGEFNVDEAGEREVQLFAPDAAVRAALQRLLAGRARVVLQGRLFHSHTAHHHRALVFSVSAARRAP